MRVVFDTNVLLSAFLFGGKSLDAIEAGMNSGAEFFISDFILRVFSEKLKGKFRIPSAEISRYTELLDTVFRKVTPSNEVPTACDDEDDNEILRLTEFVHADYLITGDKDLLKLNTFLQTKILSPAEFSKVVSHSL